MGNIIVKRGTARDWDAAIGVAWVTFQQIASHTCSEDGARAFRDGITSTQLYIDFLQDKYLLFCAYQHGKVIGMLTLKDKNHISLLFVRKKFQGKGVGTQLLKACRAYCREQGILELTVNAVSTALPFYLTNGFTMLESERFEGGLKFTPMILKNKGR